ncbi:hypothetical protein BYT27DRAFT_7189257 [Phlegmacium glaucopus]|nr:hypothetical protein BYT27DRAFT_7189257 [Phlegmacium glaucopus]
MTSRFVYSQRSKEAPMDFTWTDRSPVKPAWASGSEEQNTPRKRSHDDMNPPPSSLSTPQPFTFGSNHSVPFLLPPTTVPHTQPPSWVPPPLFSPEKAFPSQADVKDIDMADLSPFKNGECPSEPIKHENDADNGRPVATGGMRRVYNQRRKRQENRLVVARGRKAGDEDERSDSESEGEGTVTPLTQNTSNHYTLNMPAPAPPQSDLPYILLGYLQFFFNLTLILIFLYLFVQFIITVQRDVGYRISEYSKDIIQEISMCQTQYKNNLCDVKPIPAMVQQCANWESCMNRDPSTVGRAKVGAELIAEVVNGFVEPISWKTLIFTLTSLSFLTVFINSLLSLYRAKHQPIAETPSHRPPSFPIAPIAPFTPHHFNGYGSPTPTSSWGYRSDQDFESPTRRRRLDGGGAAKIK